MYMIENLRHLHADCGEIIDVEKSAVVDVVGRHTKISRAPMLLTDQRVKFTPAAQLSSFAIEPSQIALDRASNMAVILRNPRQFCFQLVSSSRHLKGPLD